jgi:hypothetical protein
VIMFLILAAAILVPVSIVGYVGLVEGRVRGYQAAYDEVGAAWQAPMLLCPRCGPETEPFRHVGSEAVPLPARQGTGRLN